jgi:hypothetical protein
LADDAALRAIRGAAEEALTAAGFLRDGRSGFDALFGALMRGHPTKKEAGLWMAAFKAVAKALARGGGFDGGGGVG